MYCFITRNGSEVLMKRTLNIFEITCCCFFQSMNKGKDCWVKLQRGVCFILKEALRQYIFGKLVDHNCNNSFFVCFFYLFFFFYPLTMQFQKNGNPTTVSCFVFVITVYKFWIKQLFKSTWNYYLICVFILTKLFIYALVVVRNENLK